MEYFFIYMGFLAVVDWHEPNWEDLSCFPYFEHKEIGEKITLFQSEQQYDCQWIWFLGYLKAHITNLLC